MRKILLYSIFMLIHGFESWAQSIIVSGKVTSENDGSSMLGVTVAVKGTSKATATDNQGNYKIEASSKQTLVYSFIGMQSLEEPVNGRNIINVSLKEGENMLSEMVVLTALGLERKKDDDLSSSTLIDTKALQRSGEAGLIQGLSGKTSGLNITRNSGDPGSGAYIQIRGQNTILGASSPLIILDGVPISNSGIGTTDLFDPRNTSGDGVVQQSRLNDINSDDIANVTILKGAAAAAVWGTGAANGVIIIQTKRGNAGGQKVSVDFTNMTAWDVVNREFDKQSTFGQGSAGRFVANVGNSWGSEIATRSGLDEVTTGNRRFVANDGSVYYPIVTKNDNKQYNDVNRDQILQTGFTWNKSLGVNLTGGQGSSYISIADWDQEGIFKAGSSYRRTNLRLNNETRFTNKIKMKFNTTYIKTAANRIQQGSNINGLYLGYLRTAPDFDNSDYKGTYYDANGDAFFNAHRSYRRYLGDAISAYNNPGWTLYEQDNPNTVHRFIINPELNWNFYKGMTLTARYGFDYYTDKRETFFPTNSAGSYGKGYFRKDIITEQNDNTNVFLSSAHLINDKFNLSWIVGTSFENFEYELDLASADIFVNPFVDDLRIFDNTTAENKGPNKHEEDKRKNAAYAVINAELFGQLYAEFTGRYERASTLKDAVFYPSASLGWVFTKNRDLKALSFGKLRASWGQVGIEPLPYSDKTKYNAYTVEGGWGDKLSPSLYANPFAHNTVKGNPNLKRELVSEFELGADLRFFKDKLGLGITYYERTTEDAILELDVPLSTGFSSTFANAAEISNKGMEIDANLRLVDNAKVNWTVNTNFSYNKNVVESLHGVASVFLHGFTSASSRAIEGEPFASLWGTRFERLNGKLVLDENGFPQAEDSESAIGDPNPNWRGGLGSTISYKGFTLGLQFETLQGNEIWSGTEGILRHFGVHSTTGNKVTLTEDLKTYSGAVVPKGSTVRGNIHDFGGGPVLLNESWYTTLGGGFGPVAEQFVVDGSWTKLRDVSLKYDLPGSILKSAKINKASLTFSGRNLIIWSPIKYYDPETNLTGASKGRGLEYFNNPGTGSYVVTLNLGF